MDVRLRSFLITPVYCQTMALTFCFQVAEMYFFLEHMPVGGESSVLFTQLVSSEIMAILGGNYYIYIEGVAALKWWYELGWCVTMGYLSLCYHTCCCHGIGCHGNHKVSWAIIDLTPDTLYRCANKTRQGYSMWRPYTIDPLVWQLYR